MKIHSRICVKFKWNIVNIYQRRPSVKKERVKKKEGANQKQRTSRYLNKFSFRFAFIFISFLIFAPTVYYIKTDRRYIFPFVDSFHFPIIHVKGFFFLSLSLRVCWFFFLVGLLVCISWRGMPGFIVDLGHLFIKCHPGQNRRQTVWSFVFYS